MSQALENAYFLYHSIGQYPQKAAALSQVMSDFAKIWSAQDDGQWPWVMAQRARFLALYAQVIGADPSTLTTFENVTQAVDVLIRALPDQALRGKKVLVAGDCFPSNHFLLSRLAERMGFTLQTVALRQGAAYVEDEDFIAEWGPDVGLALLTWVSSTSSRRINLEALVAHGRAMGSLIGVDITQGVGILPYDVAAPAVDFTVGSSLKWLCGTPGAAILQVTPALIAAARPELRGWFSQPDPFNWALDRFEYAPDIRRFDSGTPGSVAAIASLPALEWFSSEDPAALLAHNRRLQSWIIAATDELRLPLLTPRDEKARGGSLMVQLAGDTAPVVANLRQAGVYCDGRGRILRISPGVVTHDAGVEALVKGLQALRKL